MDGLASADNEVAPHAAFRDWLVNKGMLAGAVELDIMFVKSLRMVIGAAALANGGTETGNGLKLRDTALATTEESLEQAVAQQIFVMGKCAEIVPYPVVGMLFGDGAYFQLETIDRNENFRPQNLGAANSMHKIALAFKPGHYDLMLPIPGGKMRAVVVDAQPVVVVDADPAEEVL